MNFAGMNLFAIPLAALAAFVWGALYYNLLSKPWMRAARLDREAVRARPIGPMLVVSFLAELVMAWVLAGLIGHLGAGQVTLRNGLISGLFVWAGFMATALAVNHRYEGFGWDLTLIDAGHWLGVALVMGAIIGAMGV
ncbi:MAG TPA: DUF1761 domain-containing protein [Mesorhizobium sp.]|nr:DUF1761 domain-containing protein [Mesorhizobium sp.]